MDLENQKKFWIWYRKGYLLFWGTMLVFYGTRIGRTLQYWQVFIEWGTKPSRWYMLISAGLLCILCLTAALRLLIQKKQAARYLYGMSLILVCWIWVEQLFLSQIPDRFGKIPFLAAGTLFLAGWTFFVFRKEIVHEVIH
ncbi:MAG: hypothetical protein JEZ00_08020 [Anaerolineaceae bacterium]|nr:hypothetical protein [Anaerolineaceae bacterium]